MTQIPIHLEEDSTMMKVLKKMMMNKYLNKSKYMNQFKLITFHSKR